MPHTGTLPWRGLDGEARVLDVQACVLGGEVGAVGAHMNLDPVSGESKVVKNGLAILGLYLQSLICEVGHRLTFALGALCSVVD